MDPISLTGWATFAMAVVTFILAMAAFVSIYYTNEQNGTVNNHNEQTLDLMRKAFEPTLSLDLSKDRHGRPNCYEITVRNDGNGVAKKVKLCYCFYIQTEVSGETWVESENDLESHGPILDLGNLGSGLKRYESTGEIDGNKYAIYLEARCRDVFGKECKFINSKIHFDDAEEFDISS